ncbi:unannotated protein [freshwater metagenome]|uniref:Unannotated protein n=1 Tax=freshwater metagenome TaxID=449393 RepID=A0A6J6T6Q5_9ZZZZ
MNALARDEVFGATPGSASDESVLPGDQARAALLLAVQATALVAELERFGIPLSAQAKEQASEQIDAQLGQQGAPSQISETTRTVLVRFLAAQALLGERFQSINESRTEDLQLLFDRLPIAREFTCMTVAAVEPEVQGAVLKELKAPALLEELPGLFPQVKIVATSADCIPTAVLSGAIQQAVAGAAPLGVVAPPVNATDSQGAPVVYLIRVDERRTVSFEEAVPGLLNLVSQGPELWVQLLVATAQINPRYGSRVGIGPSGQPAILPPPAPELPGGGLLAPGLSSATATP